MRITFSERFSLPVDEVFSFFASPADWPRLFGFSGVRDLGSGWYAVGIRGSPFPLVARTTLVEANDLVRWTFRGFWRGEGEVKFISSPGSVLVEGYEEIAVRWLFFLSPSVERRFLETQFRAIWQSGWRRLRKGEHSTHPEAVHAAQGDPPSDPLLQRTLPR